MLYKRPKVRPVLIELLERVPYTHPKGRYLCRCGKEFIAQVQHVKGGFSQSCGCWHRELITKHGRSGRDVTYVSWNNMKNRCKHPSSPSYQYYGGRGITYCRRWEKFENFLKDMGDRPVGKTLGRINNDGNYEPGNCRWETPKEQAQNRRKPCSTSRA